MLAGAAAILVALDLALALRPLATPGVTTQCPFRRWGRLLWSENSDPKHRHLEVPGVVPI